MPAPRWAALLHGNPGTTDERYLARAFMVERIYHRNVAAHYKESTMLKYAIIFAIISLIAGLFGFTGVAAGAPACQGSVHFVLGFGRRLCGAGRHGRGRCAQDAQEAVLKTSSQGLRMQPLFIGTGCTSFYTQAHAFFAVPLLP